MAWHRPGYKPLSETMMVSLPTHICVTRPQWVDCKQRATGEHMMMSSNGNIFRVTGPLCGEFTGPGEFPTQRPVTRSFDVFFDLRLNKRLSKQLWGWWFEIPSWSLWRQCNESRKPGLWGQGDAPMDQHNKGPISLMITSLQYKFNRNSIFFEFMHFTSNYNQSLYMPLYCSCCTHVQNFVEIALLKSRWKNKISLKFET